MGAHLYAVQENFQRRAENFLAPCGQCSCSVLIWYLLHADIVSAPCKQHISMGGGINLDDKYLLQYLAIYLIINILANKMAFFVWHGCGTVAAQFLANRATLKPLIFSPINK